MDKFIYFLICSSSTLIAFFVFGHSMNEPFDVVTKLDIVWQLVLPSAFISFSLTGVYLGLSPNINAQKIIIFLTLFVLFVDIAVFIEAIYGYLWDLENHAGIK